MLAFRLVMRRLVDRRWGLNRYAWGRCTRLVLRYFFPADEKGEDSRFWFLPLFCLETFLYICLLLRSISFSHSHCLIPFFPPSQEKPHQPSHPLITSNIVASPFDRLSRLFRARSAHKVPNPCPVSAPAQASIDTARSSSWRSLGGSFFRRSFNSARPTRERGSRPDAYGVSSDEGSKDGKVGTGSPAASAASTARSCSSMRW